jgi:hypothetical protein
VCIGVFVAFVIWVTGAVIRAGSDPNRFDHIRAEMERAELLEEAEKLVKKRPHVRAGKKS